jgi:hypothetical protein
LGVPERIFCLLYPDTEIERERKRKRKKERKREREGERKREMTESLFKSDKKRTAA